MNAAERFGKNLARLRKKRKLTQEQLATKAGIHRTQVVLLEGGERQPRLETLVKLVGALEVEPTELFNGIRWDPPATKPGRLIIK